MIRMGRLMSTICLSDMNPTSFFSRVPAKNQWNPGIFLQRNVIGCNLISSWMLLKGDSRTRALRITRTCHRHNYSDVILKPSHGKQVSKVYLFLCDRVLIFSTWRLLKALVGRVCNAPGSEWSRFAILRDSWVAMLNVYGSPELTDLFTWRD